ncbi:MAG: succinate dehydrogenase iron-sulfur subunit [Campylobacterales bacterium]
MQTRKLTFKVFRFNAATDVLPTYKSYTLEVRQDEVVLDILNRIKWEQDGSLSYRRSCRHGICGSCAIKVSGKSILACKENVFALADLFDGNLVIEPSSTKRAVKDLIIDKKDFWSKYEKVKPYLIASIDEHPVKENLISPEVAAKIEDADYCIQCGVCYYACPVVEVNPDYLGPAALAKTYRFTADVRDSAKKKRLMLVDQPGMGVWDCVKCNECAEACPKGVDPIGKITHLHNQLFEEGVAADSVAARHAVVFKNTIRKHGIIDEAEVVRYSEGTLGVMKHACEAFSMLTHGKLPMPWGQAKSEHLDEVKKLVDIASTNKF